MIITQSDIFDVPATTSTILYLRFGSSYSRYMVLQNISSATLTLQLQETTDGGTTWTSYGASFALDPAGSGSDVSYKIINSANPIRVRGAGGTSSKELQIALNYFIMDSTQVWGNPLT